MTEPSLTERFPALLRLLQYTQRDIPFIQQTANADCGAACLAMILAWHGKRVPLDEVRHAAGVARHGASAYNLLRAGRYYGLRGRGVKLDDTFDFGTLPKGAILHWRFHHFVIFERAHRHDIHLIDPGKGRIRVDRDDFARSFTGVGMLFEPGEDFTKEHRTNRGLWTYVSRILQETRILGRVVTVSLMLQVLALTLPLLMGLLVDRVVPKGDFHMLGVLAAGAGIMVLFRFVCSFLRAHLLLSFRTRLDSRFTLDFLDHLVDLPYTFFEQRSTGDLVMRLNSNSNIRELLTTGTLSAVLDGFLVTCYLLLLFVTHPMLGALVVALGLSRVGTFLFVRKRYATLHADLLQAQAKANGFQVQMLAGMETLKATGTEDRAVESWSHLFVDQLNVTLEQGRLNARVEALLDSLTAASPLIILMVGAHQVLAGALSLGTMLAMSALAVGFLEPLAKLVSVGFDVQRLQGYLERINDVMQKPKEQERDTVRQPDKLKGRLLLQDVSYRYGPLAPLAVLNVSFEVEPGGFVAIVGPSGSGKSTLAALIMGLYPPTEGRILYDNSDLHQLDLKSVRRQLGIVTQNLHLFKGSIRDNISANDPAASLPQLIEAARRAHIHDDIMTMPMGYNTVLSDNGASLSGGQRQRLALARALYAKPSILLLDEATSALDNLLEEDIHRELAHLKMTRIVIAHRLSTVRGADVILVMDRGRIVERGTHETLIEKEGLYASLVAGDREAQTTSARRDHA